MADSFVQLNTDGSGKKVDTRTEGTNSEHRQVFVIGDPATNAGVAPVDATAGLKVNLGADNDVTVTGTIDLGATDNAVLDDIAAQATSIKTAVEIIDNAISGNEMQVDILTSALPTGAATSAKQDTIIGHVDGIETDTGAIKTAIELVDNVVRAEDEASAGGHSGAVVLARRTDTPANQSGTDGDYEFLQVSAGRLWVDASGKTLTVDGSGVTQPISHAALTELAAAINSSKLDINLVSSDVSMGGGVEYTEGDTDTSITGKAILWEDASDTLRAVSAAKPLPINIVSGNISGFATSAKQDTIIGHLDGVEGLLTDIETAVDGLEGKDFATETTLAAIDAGKLEETTFTSTIGEVQASPTENTVLARLKTIADNQLADSHNVTVDNASIAVTQSGTWDEVGINDSGNSITVDGTVAVTQGTAANLNMTEANSASIKTAVETLDNAISGSEMQVDVVASLPAGTNAIGKLAANSGVDIGDVDVTSVSGTVTTKETRASTPTVTSVNDTASSTTLLAANANRLGATIQNTSSAVLYVKFGTTASATDFTVRMVQYAYYEVPFNYTGRIDGIWASDPGDGIASITELTA